MQRIVLITIFIISLNGNMLGIPSVTGQCLTVCPKKNPSRPQNNIEVFLKYQRSVINVPQEVRQPPVLFSNNIQADMVQLPHGQIIPEVSMRMPSHFTVEPQAASCKDFGFAGKLKELRKAIQCKPRPLIVDIETVEGKIIPNKVLTQQCSGLCNGNKVCLPVKTVNISVPVQIVIDDRFMCSHVTVPRDEKCRCKCAITKKDCTGLQTYNKKLCQCLCSNRKEQEHCNKKSAITNLHSWDQKSCTCVCRHQTPCTTGLIWDKTLCKCLRKPDKG